jgi:hypothetical protein
MFNLLRKVHVWQYGYETDTAEIRGLLFTSIFLPAFLGKALPSEPLNVLDTQPIALSIDLGLCYFFRAPVMLWVCDLSHTLSF